MKRKYLRTSVLAIVVIFAFTLVTNEGKSGICCQKGTENPWCEAQGTAENNWCGNYGARAFGTCTDNRDCKGG